MIRIMPPISSSVIKWSQNRISCSALKADSVNPVIITGELKGALSAQKKKKEKPKGVFQRQNTTVSRLILSSCMAQTSLNHARVLILQANLSDFASYYSPGQAWMKKLDSLW